MGWDTEILDLAFLGDLDRSLELGTGSCGGVGPADTAGATAACAGAGCTGAGAASLLSVGAVTFTVAPGTSICVGMNACRGVDLPEEDVKVGLTKTGGPVARPGVGTLVAGM